LNPAPDDIRVDVQSAHPDDPPLGPETLERVIAFVLREEGHVEAEISLTLLPDPEIARLNEEYLSHDGPTDVISFPLHLPGQPPLGDIYVGLDQAARQAGELGVPLSEELLRLAIHGTLHVLGYEHPEGDERFDSSMYRRQEELLAAFLGSGGR
jgi:probable rRNA maturation factor